MRLYGAGCLVWVAYGISMGSVPLVVSQGIAAGSAVATFLTVRWRRPEGGTTPAPPHHGSPASALRIGDVLLPSPRVVSEHLVVEEARRRFARGFPGALPVVDHAGRAVGIVSAADIAEMTSARPCMRRIRSSGRTIRCEASQLSNAFARLGVVTTCDRVPWRSVPSMLWRRAAALRMLTQAATCRHLFEARALVRAYVASRAARRACLGRGRAAALRSSSNDV